MINIQMDKLPELKDHFLIQFILGKLVNYVCGCELVERNSIEEMSEYPFVTFNWITPAAPTTSDWLKDHPQYVCTMQIDVHATTTTEAMDLSLKLFNALHESNFARSFYQAQIVPQKITNTSNRTALSGINYDNDYGFDCSFLISSGFVFKESDLQFDYRDTTIKSVKLASNIHVTKNGITNS